MTFEAKTSERKSLNITCTNTPWKITNSIDWLSLSSTSGKSSSSVSVGVSENISGDDVRLGIFYVNSNVEDWKFETPITITQLGDEPYITPSKTEYDLAGTCNEQIISVSSNCTWEIHCNSSWLTIKRNGNNVSFTTTTNETASYRTATIILSHTGNKNTSTNITIRQAPASITASTESLLFDNTAAFVNITINSEASWSASSVSSWIEVTPSSGKAGTSEMMVNVSPNTSTNERTGYIILSIGGNQRIQIPVRQRGIYVEVDITSLSFNAFGGSATLHISSNTSWTIKDLPNWVTISKESGNGDATLTINAKNNNSTIQRSASFKVTQDGITIGQSIYIEQEGKYFDISAQSLEFEDKASSKSIEITAEESWTIKNSNSWISISQESGNGNKIISINVNENEEEDSRQGVVYVTMLDKTIQITISQKGKIFSIDVDNKSLLFTASGGNNYLNITSNAKWTLSNYPSWISLSNTSGKGNDKIVVTAEENTSAEERVSTMLLKIDGNNNATTINLKQYGKNINISPSELSFTSYAGAQNVSIVSDGKWNAISSESWISLSATSGTGNSSIKVSVTENMSEKQRSGIVSISMGGKTTKLSIMQCGKSFGLYPTSLSFTDKSSTKNITIETDGTWSGATTESWITLSPQSASGNSTLMVTVAENTTNASRNGVVSVTMGDKTINVSVLQEGKFFTIDNSNLSFTSKGGTIGITISTNDAWTAHTENETQWISISQKSGNGTANIKIVAEDNPSVNIRTGYVVIETPHGQNVRIIVNQKARYMTIDNNSLLFYSKGGTSDPITISTDGKFSISTSQSWLTIAQSANTFTVTANKNPNNDVRYGKITITMTDLKEGTFSLFVEVTQLNEGGTFLRKDYDEDKNWDNMGNSNGSLSITTFGDDKNYDNNSSSRTTLNVSEYSSDNNWD